MKSGAHFYQRSQSSSNRDLAARGSRDSRKNPQDRCLARTIVSHDPESLSLFDLKTDVTKRPHRGRSTAECARMPTLRRCVARSQPVLFRYSIQPYVDHEVQIASAIVASEDL